MVPRISICSPAPGYLATPAPMRSIKYQRVFERPDTEVGVEGTGILCFYSENRVIRMVKIDEEKGR